MAEMRLIGWVLKSFEIIVSGRLISMEITHGHTASNSRMSFSSGSQKMFMF